MKKKINKKAILITIVVLVVLLIGTIVLYLNTSVMKENDSLKSKEEKEFGNYSDG